LRESGEIGSYDPTRPPGATHLPPPRRHFQMELTQSQLNDWLAIDSANLDRQLEPFGVSDPAVALAPGRLRLYVHWDKYDKIVALDIAPKFAADGSATFELADLRVGNLKLPRRILSKHKRRILDALQSHVRDIGAGTQPFAGQPVRAFRDAAATVAAALAGTPVRLDLPRRIAHVRVRNIEIRRGKAVVDVVSLLKD